MKLFEILQILLELKGSRYETNEAGYIHSQTGEVLTPQFSLDPHSSIVARNPERFAIPKHMADELPDPNDQHEISAWALDNDGFAGPWQHAAYQAGWVRFYKHMGDHNLSGYPHHLLAALSMPGVMKTIAVGAREDPNTRMMVDVVHPNDTEATVETGSIFEPIHSVGDIVKVKKQIERFAR